MATLTDALWARYRASGDPQARAQLLDSYLGLVHHCARETARRLRGSVDLGDLVGAGTLGLVQALEGFEPERGHAFSTYAMPRIRGAILDELRSQDWVPRPVRERGRRLDRAATDLRAELRREPEPEEIAGRLGVDLPTYWRWHRESESRHRVSLDETAQSPLLGPQIRSALAERPEEAPEARLDRRERLEELREAFASLPARERLILTLSYYEELTLRQIGEVLHVTESRVSQLRTRALARLRERVSQNGGVS